jgi:hypothetical protein
MIDKNLSLDEANAEHEKFLANNPNMSYADPSLPLFQWAALNDLEHMKEVFEKGDSYLLMTAIRVCACHSLPLPNWAASAYIKAYDSVNNARDKSWDSVFGLPYKKGTHLSAIRKKRVTKVKVWIEIKDILKKNPKTAIDEALFESVGKKNNIGKTLASEYYYEAVKDFKF